MAVNHEFLVTLALVLCVAGVSTFVFQRLRLPVVFGYLLAGMIIGPHTAVPLVADEEITHTLAELGVILLMFSLGLEFTLRKLVRIGPTAGVIGLLQTTGMMWLGYVIGRAVGWSSLESIYAGAIIAISSTTIIIKAFAEQGIRERYSRLVFAILIVEDIVAIFILTLLTTFSSGGGLTAGTIATTAFDLTLFLLALLGIGIIVVPRMIRVVIKLDRPETTLVTSIGICFACSLLALKFGYSVALGAFIAGSLIAESGNGPAIEELVRPVASMFGAVFFVAVGMLIDLRLVLDNVGAVILLTVAVIVGKVVFVSLASFATGENVRTSVQSGMSLAQIGEFSFIIAGLGLTLGATRSFLYPVAVAVSAVTTLSTPLLIKNSARAASWVDRKLPRPLQTYAALYGSWVEHMRRRDRQPRTRSRRQLALLALDCGLLVALIIGTALKFDVFVARIGALVSISPLAARWTVLLAAGAASVPLAFGIIALTRALAHALATEAFPEPVRAADTAAAPRRALELTLHIVMVIAVGGLLVVITQPFVPLLRGSVIFGFIITSMAVVLWRSAVDLHGHTRAGAEIFATVFSRHLADEADAHHEDVVRIRQALPGLGEPVAVQVPEDSMLVNHSLRDVDLRGRTGATVLAIVHADGTETMLPDGKQPLNAGDVLFVAGSQRAIKEARRMITQSPGAAAD